MALSQWLAPLWRHPMRRAQGRHLVLAVATAWCALLPVHAQTAAAEAGPTRAQALQALAQPSARARFEAIVRLASIGTMADSDAVALRLHDDDPRVREIAAAAMWEIWSRSGNKAIDSQYQQGVEQMSASRLKEAVGTFTAIIKKQPGFAEAWNKRATLYFMLGEYQLSLKDCDEVLKRNRNHFGALSGYAQIYMQLGDLKRAITYLERALKVNPNMAGAAENLEELRERQATKERNSG